MQWVDHDMSSDTAKDNASVVDSSATDWKQEMGNTDDPGNKFMFPIELCTTYFEEM